MAAKREYSAYQQKIIKRYYDNIDTIGLQQLQELVTELYLAEGKKVEQLWKRLALVLQKIDIPETRKQHLLETRKIEYVANLVTELSSRKS